MAADGIIPHIPTRSSRDISNVERSVQETRSRWYELTQFANVLTMLRILLTPLFIWTFLAPGWELRLTSLAIFVFAAITDWWDGHHARKSKSETDIGSFLDPLADKLLTISAMAAFVWEFQSGIMLALVVVIFARDLLLTFLRTRWARRGRAFKTLWFAKLKTSVQLTVIIFIIIAWCAYTLSVEFDVFSNTVTLARLVTIFNVLIGTTAALAVISGAQYIRQIAAPEQGS